MGRSRSAESLYASARIALSQQSRLSACRQKWLISRQVRRYYCWAVSRSLGLAVLGSRPEEPTKLKRGGKTRPERGRQDEREGQPAISPGHPCVAPMAVHTE